MIRIKTIAIALTMAIGSSASAVELVVRSDGEGDYRLIQAAVDASTSGDVILLADGVYSGIGNTNIDYQGKDIVLRSASDDPTKCIIDCYADSDAQGERGVLFVSGEGDSAVLQGITIRFGQARGKEKPADRGGAIRISNSGPTITNCIFSGNCAGSGGAIYGYKSFPTIKGCRFEANTAGRGGAVFFYRGEPSIVNCVFTENTATYGGALMLRNAASRVEGCDFLSNLADKGGAIYTQESAPCDLANCLLFKNTAILGGGVYNSGTRVRITNCDLIRNAAGSGGGIHCQDESNVTIDRSVIAFSSQGESIACGSESDVRVSCSIIYGNGNGDWVGVLSNQLAKKNNAHIDPLFADVDQGNMQPRPDSPLRTEAECGRVGVLRD